MEAPQRTYTIYEISCLDTENEYTYIGSTQNFTRRKSQHKGACNNPNSSKHNIKLYTNIRNNGGWDNFKMNPLEEFKCDTKQQGHIREQYHINLSKSNLNSKKAYITEEEERKDKAKATSAKYYIENADKIKAKNAKYYIENAEKLKADKAKYYIDNKEQISIYQKIKYTCVCGSEIIKRYKSLHEKTIKHKNYISMTEN